MVNAQEWLDENCPKKERESIEEIDISNKELEGNLKLEGFVNLEILDCSYNKNITALKIIGSSKLRHLDCSNNKLTELDVSIFPKLEKFYCSDNLLTSLDLSQNEKLEYLKIGDNNFPTQDLSFLSHLANLKGLEVGNIMHWKNLDPNLYNHFSGSLEPLKNLTQLRLLDIGNTDIDSGLEYLPTSLESFNCSSDEVRDFRVKTLAAELRKYGEAKDGDFFPLFLQWKREKKMEKLEREVQELQKSTKEFKNLFILSFSLLAIVDLVILSKLGKDKNQP